MIKKTYSKTKMSAHKSY